MSIAMKDEKGGVTVHGSDLRDMARAIREDWPVPPTLRDNFLIIAQKLYEDPDTPHRVRRWAAALILAANNQNLRRAEIEAGLPNHGAPQVNVNVTVGREKQLDDMYEMVSHSGAIQDHSANHGVQQSVDTTPANGKTVAIPELPGT